MSLLKFVCAGKLRERSERSESMDHRLAYTLGSAMGLVHSFHTFILPLTMAISADLLALSEGRDQVDQSLIINGP